MTFTIYGANGYTGRLIAGEAIARGHRPTLAGRNGEALRRLGRELDLPVTTASLDDAAGLRALLGAHSAVVHCAGPFAATASVMAEACLATGTHYLDITGEIQVFEHLAGLDHRARSAGVSLLPGVGFDVIPTDCLAAHLAARLPGADRLRLAFRSRGGVSRGTALTTLQGAGRGGAIRRSGVITPVPIGWKTSEVDFGDGPRAVVTIPWGDVSTAYHSTGIGDVEVSIAMHPRRIAMIRRLRPLQGMLRTALVQRALRAVVRRSRSGPSPAEREAGGVDVWGEVRDDRTVVRSRLHGPNGYTFTALGAVRAVERVLAGTPPGFLTPSRAGGADFVLDIPGVKRIDLPAESV